MNIPGTEARDSTTDDDDEGWTRVEEQPKRNKASKSWRQRLGILRGTAISENDNESLSADVQLMAYGIAKNVTGIQLSHWLEEKRLHVASCDLLTKYEGARSLSYKIAIKSSDYEIATNPEVWPLRVGVRLFTYFNNQNSVRNAAGRSRGLAQNNTSNERKKNSGARADHEFKPKSILRNQSKQTHLSENSIQMSNNLHNASQDQNVNFFARNPFQLQNNFQNGFQSQNNANCHDGIYRFQVSDNRDPSTVNYKNINELQRVDNTHYANPVNQHLHQGNFPSPKINPPGPPTVRFRRNLTDYSYV